MNKIYLFNPSLVNWDFPHLNFNKIALNQFKIDFNAGKNINMLLKHLS
uniref:Uncharacterized protein n=1 Tax=Lepeophtheirus salmonis TaxID=72036 RepID=A0A0K2TAM2_LEPSM